MRYQVFDWFTVKRCDRLDNKHNNVIEITKLTHSHKNAFVKDHEKIPGQSFPKNKNIEKYLANLII